MRIDQHDKFWVVVDANSLSKLCDVLFETTLRGLELQFRGGLTCAENPTIFNDRTEEFVPHCAPPRR